MGDDLPGFIDILKMKYRILRIPVGIQGQDEVNRHCP